MAQAKKAERIEITPPNFKTIPVRIEGIAPLMLHKFSEKMRKQMEDKQTATDKVTKKREPKDYKAEYLAARYIARQGNWEGVPAGAFRNAMISACRDVDGLPMTRAKCAFFLNADGHDGTDGTPLIKLLNGKGPAKGTHDTRPVRLESGVADMRNRPRYDAWACELVIQYDADVVSGSDVVNLLARAGAKYGIGELRPNAKKGFGADFGLWRVVASKAKARRAA